MLNTMGLTSRVEVPVFSRVRAARHYFGFPLYITKTIVSWDFAIGAQAHTYRCYINKTVFLYSILKYLLLFQQKFLNCILWQPLKQTQKKDSSVSIIKVFIFCLYSHEELQ